MILQALYELAEAENLVGDPNFEYKPVSWVIRLKEDGTLIGVEEHRRNVNEGKTSMSGKPIKAKWVGKDELVPVQQIRTSGDATFFLVDKSEYALGIDPSGKRKADKLSLRANLFRELVERCAEETKDKNVQTLAKFLSQVAETPSTFSLPDDAGPSDLFAFRVGEGPFVHALPAVKQWWKSRRQKSEAATNRRCLVTGEPVSDAGLFPLIKRVPGGTRSGVSLVSHNARAFESYGFGGNDNAPISGRASQLAGAALNRLLHSEPDKAFGNDSLKRRHLRLSSDTAVVYWSPHGDPNALDALMGLTEAESADAVAEAYRSVWTGKPPDIQDPSAFYAMTLTGTQGRAIVRDWLETTVDEMMQNLAQHFADLGVVRNTAPPRGKEPSPTLPLRGLLEALAAPGRDAQTPAALAAEFVHAGLRGTRYPLSLLQRALLRERAEAGGDDWFASGRRDARAMLIKGVLIRTFDRAVRRSLDPTIEDGGYLAGRLMAVLEDTQYQAITGKPWGVEMPPMTARFLRAASTKPAGVFHRLLGLFHRNLAKLRMDERGQTIAFLREKQVISICNRIKAFPFHLSLAQQGMFVIGRHHQRHDLYQSRKSKEEKPK